jgi:hypothetical protein
MSELFDGRLALPPYAGRRIRWCEVVVSLNEGRAVVVQPFLAMYIHFDAHGFLDLHRQLEEAWLRMGRYQCRYDGGRLVARRTACQGSKDVARPPGDRA